MEGTTISAWPRFLVTRAKPSHMLSRVFAPGMVMTFMQTVRSARCPIRRTAGGMFDVIQVMPRIPARCFFARAMIRGACSTANVSRNSGP